MMSGSVFSDKVGSEALRGDSDTERDAEVPRSTGMKPGDCECWNACEVSAGW